MSDGPKNKLTPAEKIALQSRRQRTIDTARAMFIRAWAALEGEATISEIVELARKFEQYADAYMAEEK